MVTLIDMVAAGMGHDDLSPVARARTNWDNCIPMQVWIGLASAIGTPWTRWA